MMMNLRTMIFRWIALPVIVSVSAFHAQASPIIVTNFSFETLPAGGLTNDACGVACAWSIAPIPGWITGPNAGQFQPGTQSGNTAWFSTLSDGITSAYSNSGPISQTVAPTVQAGFTYTLVVDLGRRNEQLFQASADLLVNGVHYAATGIAPTPGNWSPFTATYNALPADIGKPITIELLTLGVQGNFDNVRLNDSVPEPASATLFAIGFLALWVWAHAARRLAGRVGTNLTED